MTGRVAGRIPRASLLTGAIATALLPALYLGLISLAQGPDHAVIQLRADFPFVVVVALGFGTQVGMFTEIRALRSRHRSSGIALGASAGASSAAMLACCAHHLVDLLPIIGLSAATAFLNDERTPLMVLGVAMNGLGIVVIGRQLIQARRACSIAAAPFAAA